MKRRRDIASTAERGKRMRQRRFDRVWTGLQHWKRRGVLLAALAGICAMLALVWAGAARMIGHEYVLTDGERHETVRLYPGTVDEACEKAGFGSLIVREQYESGGTTYLKLGDALYAEITRGGETMTVPFSPCTVAQLLEENNIILTEDEVVTPPLTEYLSYDAGISIVSVVYETVTECEEIDYGILVRESDTLKQGERKIVRAGVKGEKQVTYRVAMRDGEEVQRTALTETIVTEPVDCVIDRGTGAVETEEPQEELAWDEGVIFPGQQSGGADTDAQNGADDALSAVSGGLSTAGKEAVWSAPTNVTVDTANKRITTPDGTTHTYSSVLTVKATAYHRQEEGGLITATGTTTKYGTIAVDPSVIPLGSRVFVVAEDGTSWSYGPGLAEDTGGLIKGNRIDLFFMTGTEATNFGVRTAKIYVLN